MHISWPKSRYPLPPTDACDRHRPYRTGHPASYCFVSGEGLLVQSVGHAAACDAGKDDASIQSIYYHPHTFFSLSPQVTLQGRDILPRLHENDATESPPLVSPRRREFVRDAREFPYNFLCQGTTNDYGKTCSDCVSDYHSSFIHFHLLSKQVTAHYALPTALAFLAISTRGLVPRRDVLAFGELTGGGALVTVRRIQIEELVCARDNGKTLVLVPRENFDRLSDESIINAAGYFHEVKVSPARLRIYAWISGLLKRGLFHP